MRSTTYSALCAALALIAGGATSARAQATSHTGAPPATSAAPQVKEARPGLLRQATVTPEAATRTALTRVPNGRVQEAEIEEEHGKLVYSYDVKVPGKSGIDEVLVDAKTGAIVSHSHESPADERAEARKDARDARGRSGTKAHSGEKGKRDKKGKAPETGR